MNLFDILTMVCTVIIVVCGTISIICSRTKKGKIKKSHEDEILQKSFDMLKVFTEDIPRLMIGVESVLPNGNGDYKKDDVKSKVRAICLERGLDYPDDPVDQVIETYINVANKINCKTPSSVMPGLTKRGE